MPTAKPTPAEIRHGELLLARARHALRPTQGHEFDSLLAEKRAARTLGTVGEWAQAWADRMAANDAAAGRCLCWRCVEANPLVPRMEAARFVVRCEIAAGVA